MKPTTKKTTTGVLLLLLVAWGLSACGATRAAPSQSSPSPSRQVQTTSTESAYPTELLGQWEPGPRPCRLPLIYDSDAGFRIESRSMQGYEYTNTPMEVQAISDNPSAWRIESLKAWDDDQLSVTEIFVLSEDSLTVTDGQRSTTYQRCYPEQRRQPVSVKKSIATEFPQAVRGEWMLGPEPCYLPLNGDADGQLTITPGKMYGYEDTYEPISVSLNPGNPRSWAIELAEQIGGRRFVSNSTFTLNDSTLTVRYDDQYTAVYVKCMEK